MLRCRLLVGSLAAVAALWLAVEAVPDPPAAPWADARLQARQGLELWLDAAHVNAGRRAMKQPEIKLGAALDAWPDASGHGRHLLQEKPAQQPRLIQVGDGWVVRFDGRDDCLRHAGSERTLEAGTIFVVAAAHENPGDFRGFLSANAPQRRDYESGFTLDQGPTPGFQFDNLNVEGRGFGGARNLLTKPQPFGTLHVLEAVIAPAEKKIRLLVDGQAAGERPFTPGPVSIQEFTVGARFLTNGPGPQQVRCFLTGDIAEVLVYDRVLKDEEAAQVRAYLDAKHAALRKELPLALKLPNTLAGLGEPLEPVTPPPPVQFFVPGFVVHELPVDLNNLNNVRYRADGKLVALGYNGNVYLLSDTNGDGLEDKVELFWDNQGRLRGPIGLAVTPPGYPKGNGVFVPSKGKVSLIVDTNGDDKADEEIIVAQGWKEIPQAVDAIGMALDKGGNLYFGLGTAEYNNAYQIDQQGKSHYDLRSDRGTIQKVSPDFSKRETVCTGVRFSIGMAFNRHGDLICNDQEGATWLPNGNPFDELLHIQPGRHYGFPPRHPGHLPGVIDEPSVFDYGPQHQSTCGLVFNEPVNGGPVFGPAGWEHDALVCGESRGKLYRTQLVKTSAGYIARNQLFASLNMLTVDACVSPGGDLIVATHSGAPDWGTGPSGKGKLYRLRYADKSAPQPVATWAAGPQEVRIAFDRPLDPAHLQRLKEQSKITFGIQVRPGDRFESLFPPYAVVQMQRRLPRFPVPVLAAQVTGDRRTLILTTAPMREAVHYALALPGLGRPPLDVAGKSGLPQHPQIDLGFDQSGVQATWTPNAAGAVGWTGWLPHVDLAVARAFTKGSAAHDALWTLLEQPGTLTLRTQLQLTDMLRPAVQPGSRIEHTWPEERVTLRLTATQPFQLRLLDRKEMLESRPQGANGQELSFERAPAAGALTPVEILQKTGEQKPRVEVSWHTQEDERPRALPLHRLLLPWATLEAANMSVVLQSRPPELDGGSWARGRQVFFSEQAACAKCHKVHGQGGVIGPDLTNLTHRDYASVLRDILEPSFGINPDFITYTAELKDGRVLTGALRTHENRLIFGNEKGEDTAVTRADIERLAPAAKSIMPEDLPKLLGPERIKDLLTYLLTEPTRMPSDARQPPPAARSRAEVEAVLAGAPEPPEKVRPLQVVLVAGPKDHGPGEHDYPAWQKAWAELLAADEHTKVGAAWEWPSAAQLASADVLVFYQHGTWTVQRAKDMDAFLARGGGLVYIHWAVEGSPDAPSFAQRIGLASEQKQIKYRHGPVELGFETGGKHPIARNFQKVRFHDESYWKLVGDARRINLLASSVEDGQPQPQFWTLEPSKGRVFVSILGHFSWTFDDPLFRILLLRGIAWTAKEPVDRFNPLVKLGARMAE